MRSHHIITLWLAFLALPTSLHPQSLAHKNWAGSGLTVAPWWLGAELYAIDPISFQDSNGDGFGDLNGITTRLDYLTTLNIDAIVLSPMPLQTTGTPFDKAYGSEEDFGRLIEEATRRRIRVLVDLPLSPERSSTETLAAARFWLTRGVAGLRLVNEHGPNAQTLTPNARAEAVRALRRLCGEFAGQRVLMGDEAPSPTPRAFASHPRRRSPQRSGTQSSQGVELLLDPGPGRVGIHSTALRAALVTAERSASETATPVLFTDGPDDFAGPGDFARPTQPDAPRSFERLGDGLHNLAIARIMAALLLTSRGAPMLYFGQELGMSGTLPALMPWDVQHVQHDEHDEHDERGFTTGTPWLQPEPGKNPDPANVSAEDQDPQSLLNWYRKLGILRRQSPALRQGSEQVLDTGDNDAIAWVRRARLGESEAPDVVIAINCSPRFVSVSVAEAVGTRVLKTLAATYAADAAVTTRGLALPPFGVYIGELQRKAGLETQPDPPPRHHR